MDLEIFIPFLCLRYYGWFFSHLCPLLASSIEQVKTPKAVSSFLKNPDALCVEFVHHVERTPSLKFLWFMWSTPLRSSRKPIFLQLRHFRGWCGSASMLPCQWFFSSSGQIPWSPLVSFHDFLVLIMLTRCFESIFHYIKQTYVFFLWNSTKVYFTTSLCQFLSCNVCTFQFIRGSTSYRSIFEVWTLDNGWGSETRIYLCACLKCVGVNHSPRSQTHETQYQPLTTRKGWAVSSALYALLLTLPT